MWYNKPGFSKVETALRLEDFLVIARMMAIDALNRNESCGAHFREEYQTPDGEAARRDDEYMYVSCWKYTGDTEKPILIKEPLKYAKNGPALSREASPL